MAKMIPRLAGKWLCWIWLLPGWAAGQTPPAAADAAAQVRKAAPLATGPAGVWKGPLPIPGGSLPIQITIIQPGLNKLIATLDLPAKRLNRIPVSLTFRGDTLVFYSATADSRFTCVQSADGQELRGTWVQPGLRVPLVLLRATEGLATAAPGSKAAAAAVATTYHVEAVTITSQPGDVKLAGTLSIPDGAGPFPAAVLLSDMGGQDRDARRGNYRLFAGLAMALARQGIAVLRLDDRGVGQSGGAGALATTADLVRDAQAALNYLRLRPSVDPTRTGLIGHGEGGNVALLAAAQPLPPGFVVALAAAGLPGLELLANQPEPAAPDTARTGAARRQAWAAVLAKAGQLRGSGSNAAQVETFVTQQRLKLTNEERKQQAATLKFRRAMLEIVQQTASNDQAQAIVVNMLRQRYPDQDPGVARNRAAELTSPWSRHYLKFDPRPGLADVQCPVLLLSGADDPEVDAAVNLNALEKGLKTNKRVTARRLPGVNHLFQTPVAELLRNADGTVDPVVSGAMLDAVRDWVLAQAAE